MLHLTHTYRVAALDLELELFQRFFALRRTAASTTASDVLLLAAKLLVKEVN
jgi:hypothetical protein